MVSPPFCGVGVSHGERRAEIVPQGGGRRHQTTGWHGGPAHCEAMYNGRWPSGLRIERM